MKLRKIRVSNDRSCAKSPSLRNAGGRRAAQKVSLVLFGLFALISAGCPIYEKLAWSPDGRTLLLASDEAGKLWRWDSQTGRTDAIAVSDGGYLNAPLQSRILSCRMLPSGDKAVVLTSREEKEIYNLYYVDIDHGGEKNAELIAEKVGQIFDVASDGSVYYGLMAESSNEIVSLNRRDAQGEKRVWTPSKDFGFFRISPDGARVAYTCGDGLNLLDLDNQTTRTLVASKKNNGPDGIFWPIWLDESRLLYTAEREKESGDLNLFNLDSSTTQALVRGVAAIYPPSPSPDGKRIAATLAGRETPEGIDARQPGQIALFDFASQKLEVVTHEDFGVSSPAFSPDGKRLAYISGVALDETGSGMLWIRDLESGRDTAAWRNENERLYAVAMALEDADRPVEAIAAYDDLISHAGEKNKNARLVAQWRKTKLYLAPPLEDVDAAYEAFGEFAKEVGPDDAGMLRGAFWRESDRLATDPAADNIQKYATPESIKKDGNDEDQTRDLRAVWLRAGKKRLYIRVDYASGTDLSGIAQQDTLLLFTDQPDGASRARISEHAAWDRPLAAEAIARHWFPSEDKSQYDMEVRVKGEAVARTNVSGIELQPNSVFDVISVYNDPVSASVVYALDIARLNVEHNRQYGVQVCTEKGGIATTPAPAAKPGCDITDAFGETNTAERLLNEPDPIIQGIAGTFELKDASKK